ncbi:hypothetical protein F5Y15DRAFT_94074 [Xylariaceae sp. FL0016]|nr:hypothetical protein F5Y15DRAFT_94074 [Xylariaceae sp. FL0016]
MIKKATDAWEDDDWEVQADRAAADPEPEPEPASQAPLSKAERMAQHAEANKKLWETAEAPPQFHVLASQQSTPIPSTSDFKPAVTVLARKPKGPQMITKRDPLTGAVRQLRLDDEDSDEERRRAKQLSPEEIRAKQLREREEKQRRYDEARARLGIGEPSGGTSNPSSGTSTPGNVTPPRSSDGGRGSRGRGRGRGGHRHNESRGDRESSSGPRPGSQAGGNPRELYDSNYLPRPGPPFERRGGGTGGASLSGRSTPREDDQVIRAPRGPDGTGRGFAKRGARGG